MILVLNCRHTNLSVLTEHLIDLLLRTCVNIYQRITAIPAIAFDVSQIVNCMDRKMLLQSTRLQIECSAFIISHQ